MAFWKMKKATKRIVHLFKELTIKYKENFLCVRFEEDRPHYYVSQSVEEDGETYGEVYELTYSQFKEIYSVTNELTCENPYIEMGIH